MQHTSASFEFQSHRDLKHTRTIIRTIQSCKSPLTRRFRSFSSYQHAHYCTLLHSRVFHRNESALMCDLWKSSKGRDCPISWTRLNERGINAALPALEVPGADELYVVATQDRIAVQTRKVSSFGLSNHPHARTWNPTETLQGSQ